MFYFNNKTREALRSHGSCLCISHLFSDQVAAKPVIGLVYPSTLLWAGSSTCFVNMKYKGVHWSSCRIRRGSTHHWQHRSQSGFHRMISSCTHPCPDQRQCIPPQSYEHWLFPGYHQGKQPSRLHLSKRTRNINQVKVIDAINVTDI